MKKAGGGVNIPISSLAKNADGRRWQAHFQVGES